MFRRKLIFILLLAGSVASGQSASNRIAPGDSIAKVREQLGTPRLEFPLNGVLIQEYDSCTVKSRQGKVISVTYKEGAKPAEEPIEKKPEAPSFQDTKALAMKGDAKAQYVLGYCYQSGQAVERNPSTAAAWYTKSALQGHMPAQHNLGVMYMTGEGVEKDLEEACMWAVLAASNGNNSLLKVLQHKISDEEMLAGKQKAQQLRAELKKKASTPKTAEAARHAEGERKDSGRGTGAKAGQNEGSRVDLHLNPVELVRPSST